MKDVWLALGLTLFAGLATGIGSAIAFAARRENYRFLSVATGFSAGVMLYVSFVEIFANAADTLTEAYGDSLGPWITAASFFGGILLIGLIDNLIPAAMNPHATRSEGEREPLHYPGVSAPVLKPTGNTSCSASAAGPKSQDGDDKKLMRMGLFTAGAIALHNFPEGLATFLAALEDPALGVAIALAVAVHNIPEGISVSVPIFYATGNRRKAFLYSFLSGLAEPAGAVAAYLAMRLVFGGVGASVPKEAMGILFAGVAGIMVYISLDELLPTSRAYGKGHDSLIGLFVGMAIMALSLLLMT